MTDLRDDLALLDRRARALAQPLRLGERAAQGRDCLIFTIEDNRYALEVRFVHEVALAGEVLHVPRAAAFLGVTALRGQFLPAIDLPSWLGAKQPARRERRYVVACGEEQRELVIVVDEVVELRALDLDHEAIAEARQLLLEEGLCVVNGRALLDDPRHFVRTADEAAGAREQRSSE